MADRNKKKTSGWHWNCASALCTNNFRTEGVTYFTLPSEPELQKGYAKVLMNENVNWRKHVICSARWSDGRKSKNQIPDVICTEEYADKIAQEYSKKPTVSLLMSFTAIFKTNLRLLIWRVDVDFHYFFGFFFYPYHDLSGFVLWKVGTLPTFSSPSFLRSLFSSWGHSQIILSVIMWSMMVFVTVRSKLFFCIKNRLKLFVSGW